MAITRKSYLENFLILQVYFLSKEKEKTQQECLLVKEVLKEQIRRFHLVSLGMPAKRLSTAFDSVTLYGNDPGEDPIFMVKLGMQEFPSVVLDDLKKLYSGFELANPMTSVSMTINGPAPMLLAYFMNAAIDQECEKYISENGLENQVQQKIEIIYKKKELNDQNIKGNYQKGTKD